MRPLFPWFTLLVVFNACSTYRFVDIQVLTPATVKIPVKSDTLIVRGPFENKIAPQAKLVKDSSKTPFYKLISNSFTSELKKGLVESPAFEDITIVLLPIITDSSTYSKINNGNLLTLDFLFRAMIDTTYSKNYGYFYPYGYLVIYYKYQFQLLNKGKILDWYQFSNNYTWFKKDYKDDGAKALAEIGRIVARHYAKRIAPYWSTEERMLFFSSNSKMVKAYDLFCDNKLEEAMAIYKNLYEVGTKKLASRAAYNIGLIFEMLDDLESSECWLVESNKKEMSPKTSKYIDIIRKRKLTKMSLDQQLQ